MTDYTTIPRGRVFLLSERILNPDYSPVNLTGCTSTLHVVDEYGTTPVLSLDETDGISLGTDGMAVCSIDPADLAGDYYAFEWILLDSGGVELFAKTGVFFMGVSV